MRLIYPAPARRIMSLTKPDKKMSKSDSNSKSRISITDSKEDIQKKIKAAVTDSEDGITYDPQNRPALANLINLMHFLQEDESQSPEDSIEGCASKKALKDKLTSIIEEHVLPIRERYHELMSSSNQEHLNEIARIGASKARNSAEKTMKEVRCAIGFS
jgi:tryptophanyl-tRNA synthetase